MDLLCKPSFFNDPFEISPTFSAPDEKTVAKFFDRHYLSQSKSLRARVIKESHLKLKSIHLQAVDESWVAELGILCLTNDPKNLLMWSHYASSHTGVCIGFDSAFPPFCTAKAVKYTSERPQVPLIENPIVNEAIVESIFLSKSPHWKYESESRCIKRPIRESEKEFYKRSLESGELDIDAVAEILASDGGSGFYEFNPLAIKRVILGAKIARDHKDKILNMTSKMPWIKIFQAELDKKHFFLNLNEIKTKS